MNDEERDDGVEKALSSINWEAFKEALAKGTFASTIAGTPVMSQEMLDRIRQAPPRRMSMWTDLRADMMRPLEVQLDPAALRGIRPEMMRTNGRPMLWIDDMDNMMRRNFIDYATILDPALKGKRPKLFKNNPPTEDEIKKEWG